MVVRRWIGCFHCLCSIICFLSFSAFNSIILFSWIVCVAFTGFLKRWGDEGLRLDTHHTTIHLVSSFFFVTQCPGSRFFSILNTGDHGREPAALTKRITRSSTSTSNGPYARSGSEPYGRSSSTLHRLGVCGHIRVQF